MTCSKVLLDSRTKGFRGIKQKMCVVSSYSELIEFFRLFTWTNKFAAKNQVNSDQKIFCA